MAEHHRKKATFEHVGPRVSYGDVEISLEDAELFRQTALEGTKIRELQIGEHATRIVTSSYASGVLSTAAADYAVAESAYFSKSIAGAKPNYWRSEMTFARYNQKNSDTKIYNIYDVESVEGELVRAVRTVRVIKNFSRIAINAQGDPYEDMLSRWRKVYEKNMQPEDVRLVQQNAQRIMSRQRVLNSRTR